MYELVPSTCGSLALGHTSHDNGLKRSTDGLQYGVDIKEMRPIVISNNMNSSRCPLLGPGYLPTVYGSAVLPQPARHMYKHCGIKVINQDIEPRAIVGCTMVCTMLDVCTYI